MDFKLILLKIKIGIVLLSLISLVIIMLEGFIANRDSQMKGQLKKMYLNNRKEQSADIEEIILEEHENDFPFRFFKFTSSNLINAYGPQVKLNNEYNPVLFLHGHKGGFRQIQQFNGYLTRVLLQTTRIKPEHHIFKFFAVDFREAPSAYSFKIIKKEALFTIKCLQYLRNISTRKLTIIAHSMGGLVALQALATSDKEILELINQIIYLNSPLTQPPLLLHNSFTYGYQQIYQLINKNDFIRNIKMFSFTSGKQDLLVNSHTTYLKIKKNQDEEPMENIFNFNLENLRNVYVSVDHNQILTYPPFINLLSKYLILDSNKLIFSRNQIVGHFEYTSKYEDQLFKQAYGIGDYSCSTANLKNLEYVNNYSSIDAELKGGRKCMTLNFSEQNLKKDEKLLINTNIFSENIQIYLNVKSYSSENNTYTQLSPIFTDFFRTIYLLNVRKDDIYLIYLQQNSVTDHTFQEFNFSVDQLDEISLKYFIFKVQFITIIEEITISDEINKPYLVQPNSMLINKFSFDKDYIQVKKLCNQIIPIKQNYKIENFQYLTFVLLQDDQMSQRFQVQFMKNHSDCVQLEIFNYRKKKIIIFHDQQHQQEISPQQDQLEYMSVLMKNFREKIIIYFHFLTLLMIAQQIVTTSKGQINDLPAIYIIHKVFKLTFYHFTLIYVSNWIQLIFHVDGQDLQLREPEFNFLIPQRIRIYIPISFLLTVLSIAIFFVLSLIFALVVFISQCFTNVIDSYVNFQKYLGNFDKMKISLGICSLFCIVTLESMNKWIFLFIFLVVFLSTLKITNRTQQGKQMAEIFFFLIFQLYFLNFTNVLLVYDENDYNQHIIDKHEYDFEYAIIILWTFLAFNIESLIEKNENQNFLIVYIHLIAAIMLILDNQGLGMANSLLSYFSIFFLIWIYKSYFINFFIKNEHKN